MKLTKLEAYRIFSLSRCVGPLVIRHDGNDSLISKELDRIWQEDCSKVAQVPKSAPTLTFMKNAIAENRFVSKYVPSN